MHIVILHILRFFDWRYTLVIKIFLCYYKVLLKYKEKNMNLKKRTLEIIAIASVMAGITVADACTGIRLTAKDGSVIHARTLEFAVDVKSDIIIVPRGYKRTGTAPNKTKGMSWTTKYASVGANGVGQPVLFDGLNEKGLAVGFFYHPHTAKYMPYKPSDAPNTLGSWELGTWILDSFATVDEVKKNINKVVVSDAIFPPWGFAPPAHFVVHDATGKSIVIEFLNGKLVVFENPLGIITNSPSYDWHMTNIRNYINISLTPVNEMKIDGVTLKSFGMGSGLHGIPGDFTPPSRFVRATIFSKASLPQKTGYDAVIEAFHILNNFDIPKGTAREHAKDKHGNVIAEFTQWTAASDLKAKKYYIRTYDNSQIKMIDLNKMNLDAKEIITIPLKSKEVVKELN